MPSLLSALAIPTLSLAAPGGEALRLGRAEGTVPYATDALRPHRKDHYLLVLVRRGGTHVWVDGTRYAPQPGTLFFTDPGALHIKEEPQPVWSSSVAFTPAYLAAHPHAALARLPLLHNPRRQHVLALPPEALAFTETVLTQLEATGPATGPGPAALRAAHLAVLLTYLSHLYEGQFPADAAPTATALLHQFRTLLAEHYAAHHDVAAYATRLHVSAGHLSAVVKAQSGRAALAHIQERLGLEARRLLLHTGQSVKEIADGLGFADASYFGRFFRRHTGRSPVAYRQQGRKMYP